MRVRACAFGQQLKKENSRIKEAVMVCFLLSRGHVPDQRPHAPRAACRQFVRWHNRVKHAARTSNYLGDCYFTGQYVPAGMRAPTASEMMAVYSYGHDRSRGTSAGNAEATVDSFPFVELQFVKLPHHDRAGASGKHCGAMAWGEDPRYCLRRKRPSRRVGKFGMESLPGDCLPGWTKKKSVLLLFFTSRRTGS